MEVILDVVMTVLLLHFGSWYVKVQAIVGVVLTVLSPHVGSWYVDRKSSWT